MMKLCLIVAVLVLGTAHCYPLEDELSLQHFNQLIEIQDSYDDTMRARRSPGQFDFNAGYGPGRTGSLDAQYSHRVWNGRGGQSFDLNGGYNGQYGGGKPRHNFGIGGTYRFLKPLPK